MSESTLAVSALARAEESPAIRMIEKFFGSGGVPPPSRSEATSAINVMDSCVAAGRRLSQVHAVFEWRSDECHGHAGWRGCAAIGSGGVPPPWRSEATSAMSETNVMDSQVGGGAQPLGVAASRRLGEARLRLRCRRQMSWTRGLAARRRLSQVHAVFEWRRDKCHGLVCGGETPTFQEKSHRPGRAMAL